MFSSMKVKTPSFTIPSISVRIEIVIALLLLILFTTCFTFQSCCRVGWTEGYANLRETFQELRSEVTNINPNKKKKCSAST